MPTNRLYHTWIQQILELRLGQRITQTRNFVWLWIGIYESRSVSLSRIANKIPSPAQLLSLTRRLSRLLENPAIDVRSWYEPIARRWLEQQTQDLQQVMLIVDGHYLERLAEPREVSRVVRMHWNVPCDCLFTASIVGRFTSNRSQLIQLMIRISFPHHFGHSQKEAAILFPNLNLCTYDRSDSDYVERPSNNNKPKNQNS